RRSSVLGASLAPHLAATFTQWNSGSIGLHLVLQTYPAQLCLIWFVYLGSSVCRQLPSASTSRWTPLSLADGSYYQVRRRLSLPRHNTWPAHNKKRQQHKIAVSFQLCITQQPYFSMTSITLGCSSSHSTSKALLTVMKF